MMAATIALGTYVRMYDYTDMEVCEDNDVMDDLQHIDANYFDGAAESPPLVLWIVHFLALLYRKCSLTKTALELLLRFLKIFFSVLCRISPLLNGLAQHFPCSIDQMDKVLGTRKETFVRYVVCARKETFVRYVVCTKCHSVYSYEDCMTVESFMHVPQVCKQRTSNYGRPCNGTLLKNALNCWTTKLFTTQLTGSWLTTKNVVYWLAS